jgi:hypothetical protein
MGPFWPYLPQNSAWSVEIYERFLPTLAKIMTKVFFTIGQGAKPVSNLLVGFCKYLRIS